MTLEKKLSGWEMVGKSLVWSIWAISAFIGKGWLISTLWMWFIVPLGVIPIGKAHGYGIALLLAIFNMQKTKDEEGKGLRTRIALSAAEFLLTYLFAYIAHRIMVS